MRRTETFAAFITLDGGVQHLLTVASCAGWHALRRCLPSHRRALPREMFLHSDVWILPRFKGHWSIAHRTVWRYTIVFSFIVLGALMCLDFEVFLTERLPTMLTIER
jgi:hypothetical protein